MYMAECVMKRMLKFSLLVCVLLGLAFAAACDGTTPEPVDSGDTGGAGDSGTVDEPPELAIRTFMAVDGSVLIEANRLLFDVEWMHIEAYFTDDETYFIPHRPAGVLPVAQLAAGTALVFPNFMSHGTMPSHAVAFRLEAGGERYYFALMEDHSFGLDPSPYAADFLAAAVDGRVRITATTGSGATTDLGYIDVDAENFDPDVWMTQNAYRWAAQIIVVWPIHILR